MKKFLEKHGKLIAILAPIIFGAIYMIICSLNLEQSIWFDESFGAYLTRFSFGDIWTLTAADVHPPLYYFLLKIWAGIFGYTDFAMRFMSVFFGAVAIVFAWHWLKRKFGAKPALIATLLMSISPMFIRYGQEMRMYAMAAAIIFAATYVLQLAIDTKKRKFWIIYGILVSLGMWTHYFVAFVWMAQLAYLIYKCKKKIFQKDIVCAYILAVVLYLPWLPILIFQTGVVQSGFWIPEPNFSTVSSYFTNTFFYLNANELAGWMMVWASLTAIALTYLAVKAKKKTTLLNFMAFVPPTLLLIASLPPLSPVFMDRYVVYSAICLSLIAGVAIGIVKFKKKFTPFILTALLAMVSLVGVVNVFNFGNFNKSTNGQSDAKALFEAVALISDEGTPIISRSEWLYYDLAFYGNDIHPVYFVDALTTYEWGSHEPLKQKDYGKIMNFEEFLDEHETVWLVGSAKKTAELDFEYDGYEIVQSMYLDVNVNQDGYRAIEVRKL